MISCNSNEPTVSHGCRDMQLQKLCGHDICVEVKKVKVCYLLECCLHESDSCPEVLCNLGSGS